MGHHPFLYKDPLPFIVNWIPFFYRLVSSTDFHPQILLSVSKSRPQCNSFSLHVHFKNSPEDPFIPLTGTSWKLFLCDKGQQSWNLPSEWSESRFPVSVLGDLPAWWIISQIWTWNNNVFRNWKSQINLHFMHYFSGKYLKDILQQSMINQVKMWKAANRHAHRRKVMESHH